MRGLVGGGDDTLTRIRQSASPYPLERLFNKKPFGVPVRYTGTIERLANSVMAKVVSQHELISLDSRQGHCKLVIYLLQDRGLVNRFQ